MSTDDDIKRDVEYELKWDPDIDPSDIGVAVKDGAVTLSARLAARAADSEHGCAGRGQSEFWRLRTPARAKTRVGPPIQYANFAIRPGQLVTSRGLGGQGRLRNHRVEPSFFQGHRAAIDSRPDSRRAPAAIPRTLLKFRARVPILGFAQAVALSRCVIRFVCQRPGR
jgi:hypothetical protein